jgi:hypothetical protein
MATQQMLAPCSGCLRETTHDVLFQVGAPDSIFTAMTHTHRLLKCAGCGEVCLAENWINPDGHENPVRYYPSPVSRKVPEWLSRSGVRSLETFGKMLRELFEEIYVAIHGGQYRLAAIGIRALLEQVMIEKVGDHGTFERNLDEFQKGGYLSGLQRDAVRTTLDVGDAAMHRGFKPTESDLNLALDIIEGVFAPIFNHESEAQWLAARIPPRSSARKPPQGP